MKKVKRKILKFIKLKLVCPVCFSENRKLKDWKKVNHFFSVFLDFFPLSVGYCFYS